METQTFANAGDDTVGMARHETAVQVPKAFDADLARLQAVADVLTEHIANLPAQARRSPGCPYRPARAL